MSVGIKDVARVAGVAPSTVSRALGKGPVSSEVRARVEAAVRATGYRANLSARRLRMRRTQTVGLIVADIRDPYFAAVGRAVEDAAYEAGMRVILCNTDEDADREFRYLSMMQEEQVTGLIFAPSPAAFEILPSLKFGFPVVLVDRIGLACQFDAVALDSREASTMLVEHLFAQGRRRILGIFGDADATSAERHEGYASAMARLGLPSHARRVAPPLDAVMQDALSWLRAADRPEAVIVGDGVILQAIVRAVRGRAMPEDLEVAGFGDEPWISLLEPGLTIVEQPVDAIGREAMALLFERLQRPFLPARKVVLSGRCKVRGSSPTSPIRHA